MGAHFSHSVFTLANNLACAHHPEVSLPLEAEATLTFPETSPEQTVGPEQLGLDSGVQLASSLFQEPWLKRVIHVETFAGLAAASCPQAEGALL